MSSRVRKALSVVLLTSGLLAAPACDSESVTGGSQVVTLTFTLGPTGIGRYTSATWIVRRIRVLPTDPATAALYGSNQLLLFFTPLDVNLAATQAQTVSTISLAPGNYRVSFLEVTPLVLLDEDVDPNPATCIDGIAVIDGTKPCTVNPITQRCEPDIPSEIGFTNPAYGFAVTAGQTTNVNLNVNVPALIDGYEAMYTCTPGCGPGGTPCLTGFDLSIYRAAVLANISLE